MPAPRRRLARLLLFVTSLGVALFVAELAVRLVRPQEAMSVDRGLYEPDPPRRYRLHPGFHGRITNHVEFSHGVAINALGMRGRDLPPAPARQSDGASETAPGGLRVLALGDSFTFGVGAAEDETYPARLEAHLREAGVRATVANAGAPGYGVPDEVAWYERWGPEAAPDVVVIAPFLANDLQDAAPATSVRVVGGELVAGDQRGGARRWLYYHSHLFRLLKSSLLEGALRGRLGLAEPWARRQQRAELALYAPAPPAELGAAIAATDAAIARFAKLTTERHERAVAVLVPSLPQVDPRRWQAIHRELGVDPRGHDPRRSNQLFRELFARHGVVVLDPTDALAAAVAGGAQIYYPRDQHLTPLGYDLLARQVAAELLRGRGSP